MTKPVPLERSISRVSQMSACSISDGVPNPAMRKKLQRLPGVAFRQGDVCRQHHPLVGLTGFGICFSKCCVVDAISYFNAE
jgi:hypothetical protein